MADQSHSLADARCNPADAATETRLATTAPESQDQHSGDFADLAAPRIGRGVAKAMPIEPRRSGRLSMSRRQLVGAAMVSPAVVMNAIVDNGIEEDPALDLWRQWRKALAKWSEANDIYDKARVAVLRMFPSELEEAATKQQLQLAKFREPKPLSVECQSYYSAQFAAFDARSAAKEEMLEEHGIADLEEIADRAEAAQYAAIAAIEAFHSRSSVAVAARLHVALDWDLDDMGDFATQMAVSIVRDLLPELPEEMAAALRRQINGLGNWKDKCDSTQTV